MIRIILIVLTVVLGGCTYNQDKHIHELFTKERGSLPKERDAWIVEQSLGHPSDEFTLAIEPYDPLTTPKGTFPLVLLKGDRVPLEERLIFAIVDTVNGKIDPQFEFEVQEAGNLKIFDKNGVRFENEIPFVACDGLIVGKPILYAVVSKEKFTIATAEFIPYPLETKMEEGPQVSLVVTHPMLTRFQLRANGFDANERVKLIHQSGNQREEVVMFANEEGNFSFGLNPTVLGRLGGEANLTIERGGEEFSLDYPWGAKLESRAFHERTLFPVLFVVNQLPDEINSERVQHSFAKIFKMDNSANI
ncbi:MAG TPA: hypothetical protein VLE89_01565 [Chlamydiales bacterium]|nr:hypothetical protein [Chlamydiales bacterium]